MKDILFSKKAPSQEAWILRALNRYNSSNKPLLSITRLRDHLRHAAEAFALTEFSPKEVNLFDVLNPPGQDFNNRRVLHMDLPIGLKSIAFDGLFGVNRRLEKGIDVRTKGLVGRPRLKFINWNRRSASCITKEKVREQLPQRTGGWLFLSDSREGNGNVLAAYEFINNENMAEKQAVVAGVLQRPGASGVNTLLHDDMCNLAPSAMKKHKKKFKKINMWLIDKPHRKKHCRKCVYKFISKDDQKKEAKLNTNRAEQFNSYVRRSDGFLNGLRISSHRFWVYALMRHSNRTGKYMSKHVCSRTNALQRGQ